MSHEIRRHDGYTHRPNHESGVRVSAHPNVTAACNALLKIADEIHESGGGTSGGGHILYAKTADGRRYTYRVWRWDFTD